MQPGVSRREHCTQRQPLAADSVWLLRTNSIGASPSTGPAPLLCLYSGAVVPRSSGATVVSEPVEAVGKDAQADFLDSGLLGALLGATAERIAKDRSILGPLETFVFSEVLKQASWFGESCALYHYRDKDQDEVDLGSKREVAHWSVSRSRRALP